MELPPSGWYPDPYGVPGLLRWWDGSLWTRHTHTISGSDATDGAGPGAASGPGVQQTTVQPAVQQTTVQPGMQATTVQPSVQPTTVQPGVRPTTVQPAVQPTVYQPAVTSVQPTTVQPTTVQPGVQPTTVQPSVQPAGAGARAVFPPPLNGPQGPDGNGTQVLFLPDDAWNAPGGPGGPAVGSDYGYYRAQRRRRMWLFAGLAGGTAVTLAVIALVVNSLGNSHPAPSASHPTKAAVATKGPAPTPSPTPSATQPAALVTDGVSGLSYSQLPSPWQPSCPTALNGQGFTFTAGESAIAGQVNGGQTTWYGEACSGPLPQSFGYHTVSDLESTTQNLVNTFANQYYNQLQHGFQQGASDPVTISGHPGWEIKFLITYSNAQGQGLPFTDEQGAVVLVDLGTATPAVFFVSIPTNLGESHVDSLVSGMQATVPAQPGGGGSPGDGSPGAGSPGPSDNGNGNGDGHGHGN